MPEFRLLTTIFHRLVWLAFFAVACVSQEILPIKTVAIPASATAVKQTPTPTVRQIPSPIPTATITPPAPASYLGPLPEGILARLGKGNLREIALSPDGETLAAASNVGIFFYDPGTLEQTRLILTGSPVESIAWSPDGEAIAAAEPLVEAVSLWSAVTGQWLDSLPVGSVNDLDWSPDGKTLAAGLEQNGFIEIWDIETGSLVLSFEGHTTESHTSLRVYEVAWSSTGKLASSGVDNRVVVWDINSGAPEFTLDEASVFAWSPDGTTLAAIDNRGDDRVTFWNGETGEQLKTVLTDPRIWLIGNLSWSPDGSKLAVGSYDPIVTVWDLSTGGLQSELTGHTWLPYSLAWLDGGSRLAAVGSGGELLITWEVETGSVQRVIRGTSRVDQVAWSPDGKTLAANHSGSIILWDVDSNAIIFALDIFKLNFPDPGYGSLRRMAFSPDGSIIALLYGDDSAFLELVNTRTGEFLDFEIPAYPADFAWSPDGALIATVPRSYNQSHALTLWDAVTGEERQVIELDCAEAIEWSPDGKLIAVRCGGKITILSFESGEALLALNGELARVIDMEWSPDSSKIVSVTAAGTIAVWDVKTGAPLYSIEASSQAVLSVSWSPDGKRFATTAVLPDDIDFSEGYYEPYIYNRVVVWDSATGQALYTSGDLYRVGDVAFRPIGNVLALASADGTVWLVEP